MYVLCEYELLTCIINIVILLYNSSYSHYNYIISIMKYSIIMIHNTNNTDNNNTLVVGDIPVLVNLIFIFSKRYYISIFN